MVLALLYAVTGQLQLNAINSIAPHLKYHKSKETLDTILHLIKTQQKGMYLRFGDGDVNLATGKGDMLQKSNPRLQQEMREALSINGPGVLKSLCLQCAKFGGYEEGMIAGKFLSNYQISHDMLRKVKPLWGADITDIYAVTALHYLATDHTQEAIRFLQLLKRSNCTVFVGNRNIPHAIRESLFGSQCAFVSAPPEQSYNQIDRIERLVLHKLSDSSEYQVVIVAMGCAGRVLQKRLWQKADNLFIFDFGSLMDALCGWDTRAWMQLSNFNHQEFLKRMLQKMHVVCTAALIDHKFEERQKEYEYSLQLLNWYGVKPYIVESCKNSRTFLDDYGVVCYTHTNILSLKNKGVNEALALREGLNHFKFPDDDMIIKLTGRYHFNSDEFLHLARERTDVDAIVKYDSHGQVITGCCAMRCKYFKEMLGSIDYIAMEKKMINLEWQASNFIKRKNPKLKVLVVDELQVTANIFGTGQGTLEQW